LQDNFFKDPERLAEFLARMKELMRQKNLKHQDDFNEAIGTQRALTRWKSGESTPSLNSCVAIRKAFGKSLDWIILGEQSPQFLHEPAAEPYEARPLASQDFELLNDSIEKVEEELNEEKKALTKGQKFRLILRVYNDCVEFQKKPDRDMVKRYLSVMD
jgi:hypothetical protein